MQKFHSAEYVDFLRKISPDNMKVRTGQGLPFPSQPNLA